MPKPNFFIVGLPKCGTTSLFRLLETHPQIYTPKVKEPAFFNPQRTNRVKEIDAYLAMFEQAQPQHKAIGEGSTCYAYTPGALENIREFAPDARIIIMFREPISLCRSLHQFLTYLGTEDAPTFEQAWRMQADRAKGIGVPPTNGLPLQLQYGYVAQMGKHLQHLLEVFPKEQVLTVFLEDLGKKPAEVYSQVLQHLGVDHDGRTEFPRSNVGQLAGNSARAHGKLRQLAYRVKSFLPGGNWHKSPAVRKLNNMLVGLMSKKKVQKEELSPDFVRELRAFFEEDTRLLESLTGRDLSHWRKTD
jgi:hypothetical protein